MPRLVHELQVHQIELEIQNEELKQAKADIEEGLQKFTDLYDFAPVGYFSLDEQGRILEVNLTCAALLGAERSSLTGRGFQHFVAPSSRPLFHAFLSKIFLNRERRSCEVSILHSDHGVFWAELQAATVGSPVGEPKYCRVAMTDIDARKKEEETQRRVDRLSGTNQRLELEIVRRRTSESALRQSEQRARHLLKQSHSLQKKLRQMTHRVLLVQETQRKEISRELHDEISQLLLGINMRLAIFTRAAFNDPKSIRRTVKPVRRLVEKAVQVVHQFARELRPAMLDDLGLVPALRSYIDSFPKRKGRRIQLSVIGAVNDLNTEKRTVLYRVAQEALINAAKHAKASHVKVVVCRNLGVIRLEITDDGKGFGLAGLSAGQWGQRLGLLGMRERVEMAGGRFDVTSAPGEGTTIQADLPLGKKSIRSKVIRLAAASA